MKQMILKNGKKKINRKDLTYQAGKYKYDFQQIEKIRFFGGSIYTGKTNIDEAAMDETSILEIWQNLMINLEQVKKDKEKKEMLEN